MADDRRKIRSYVRRQGRMSDLQRKSYEALRDEYCIPFSESPINFAYLFPQCTQVVIEIGFGMGVTTAEIASDNPGTGYLGIEVHTPGVGKLLSEIRRRALENVRIVQHDAVEVMAGMIADSRVDGCHIFFPDPWPKKKHHKRRLIQPPFLSLLASKLKEGGYLYAVTDWEEYAEHILEAVSVSSEFENQFEGYAAPLSWRPKTKFEEKGLQKKHSIFEVYAIRRFPARPSRR